MKVVKALFAFIATIAFLLDLITVFVILTSNAFKRGLMFMPGEQQEALSILLFGALFYVGGFISREEHR